MSDQRTPSSQARDAAADTIRALQVRLEASEHACDEFLSKVSHELRTPLNSMLGWLRLAQTGTLDTAQQQRALATIERNIRAQVALIDDLWEARQATAAQNADAAFRHSTRQSLECPPALNGLRVLVVDDEPDARDLLQSILSQCHAKVRAAASATEALDALETFVPNVVVSDIGMPDLDGYHLISEIRRRPPDRGGRVPAIALTAYARIEDRARCLRSGFQVHVPKPVEPVEILAIVASLAPTSAA